jgi:DNA-binding NtrC family response regulator
LVEREAEPPDPLQDLDLSGSLSEATRRALAVVEKVKIQQVLKEADDNKGRAAELLQIGYKMLLSKLKEHRIE